MNSHRMSEARCPRTLVTGGAGFVGSHLCDRLLAEGHEVVCVDNLLTGTLENVQHLTSNPKLRFIHQDVTEPGGLARSLAALEKTEGRDTAVPQLDYILHLASPASPKDYDRFPIETLMAGSVGTREALELARSRGSVFLLASSSEVYGDPEVSPQTESYWGNVNPIGPRSVYDEAKRFGEALTMAYQRQYALQTRIARIFNTYGERMRVNDGRVLPNFMVQVLRDEPVTIYGNGKQTRSFCYVEDTVDGLYRLLLSDVTQPVNIGNPEEVTILEFANELLELTSSRSPIKFVSLPTDDPQRRKPDILKAVNVLGWRPKVTRRDGLRRVIPYFEGHVRPKTAVAV
jgi:dTDP-glucose 4,6-dehydratase